MDNDNNYYNESKIKWSDELNTGNEIIDTQHLKIFKITNNFIEAYLQENSKEILGDMLDFLIEYTIEHFLYEEKLMIEYNYPKFEYHKKCHEDFKDIVGEFKSEFEIQGATENLNKKLSGIIVRWLIIHIKHEDFKIAKYIRGESKDN